MRTVIPKIRKDRPIFTSDWRIDNIARACADAPPRLVGIAYAASVKIEQQMLLFRMTRRLYEDFPTTLRRVTRRPSLTVD